MQLFLLITACVFWACLVSFIVFYITISNDEGIEIKNLKYSVKSLNDRMWSIVHSRDRLLKHLGLEEKTIPGHTYITEKEDKT